MAEERKYTPPPKTALDNPKLRIDGPKLEGANRRSQLSFEIFRNNPRIAVYYNDERTKPTYARMESDSFFFLLEQLEAIALGKRKAVKIRNKHSYDQQGNKLPTPDVVSQTVAGVDEEHGGKIFLSVVEKDKPLLKFYFEPNYWYTVVDENNTPIPDDELSKALCLSKVRLLQKLFANVMVKEYVHPQRQGGGNFGGGNRGGGNNQRSSGGGGGWSSSSGGSGNTTAPSNEGLFEDIAI